MRRYGHDTPCSCRADAETAAMNRSPLNTACASLVLACTSTHVSAASSEWVGAEGGAVRMVAEPASHNGKLRAALEIRLEPGWKTYWRDPGESGIPPMIDVATAEGPAGVEIGYPAPERFNDGYSTWVGYDGPVSLALTIDVPAGARKLSASVLVGICETICIPLQADLALDLGDDTAGQADADLVDAAFAALPRGAGASFEASVSDVSGTRIVVDTRAPSTQDLSLFVASSGDWLFGTPTPLGNGNSTAFEVPVFAAPDAPSVPQLIHYILAAGGDAVAGTFEIAR